MSYNRNSDEVFGKNLTVSSGAQRPVEPVVSGQLTDERLRNFGEVWNMDGDLMRCTGCSRAIIASRKNEIPVHAHTCQKDGYMDNQNPWLLLTNWLLAH